MKHAILAIALTACMCSSASAWAQKAESQPASPFSPAMEGIIASWPATVRASFPPEAVALRERVERPRSSVPGRMHVPRRLIIDKPRCRGYMVDALGDTLLNVAVCASRNRGQKHKADDCRTPEGTFPLYGVYNSTDWTYEDTDDKCYGPWFLSLKTPRYWGVGVHGTNSPGSVPGRRSHGCIRMHNENIVRVKALVQKDIRVTVVADPVPDADL